MASRPVYISCGEPPFVQIYQAEFTWNGGFAASQKQKNININNGQVMQKV